MIARIEEKRFGEKIIFSDAVFNVPPLSHTAILGPSGRGKTTLMRILSGLDREWKGSIEDSPEHPLVLFQEDRLTESIPALSNLKAVSDDAGAIRKVLSDTGLSGEERKSVHEFSGGMKRRLAIARILLLDGDFLFLDEPFRGLDDSMRAHIASLLLDHAAGRTLVFITHDEDDLSLLGADSIIEL